MMESTKPEPITLTLTQADMDKLTAAYAKGSTALYDMISSEAVRTGNTHFPDTVILRVNSDLLISCLERFIGEILWLKSTGIDVQVRDAAITDNRMAQLLLTPGIDSNNEIRGYVDHINNQICICMWHLRNNGDGWNLIHTIKIPRNMMESLMRVRPPKPG